MRFVVDHVYQSNLGALVLSAHAHKLVGHWQVKVSECVLLHATDLVIAYSMAFIINSLRYVACSTSMQGTCMCSKEL